MQTKIYSYGAMFRACPQKLDTLLRQQVRYYNTLVELENLRRAMFHGLEEDAGSGVAEAAASLDECEKQVQAAVDAISQHRKETRARAVPVELRSVKDAAIARKKEASDVLRAVKATHRAQFAAPADEFLRRKTAATSTVSLDELRKLSGDELRKRVTKIREAAGPIAPRTAEKLNSEILDTMLSESDWSPHWKLNQLMESVILAHVKEARAVSELPHGTYSLAEDAVDAAKKSQKVGDLDRKWVQYPEDLPVDDSGRVGIQLAGGLSVPDLLAGNSPRLRLTVETNEDRSAKGLGGRSARWLRRNSRAVARIAIDSGDDGWEYLEVPISYHRPLPTNATVKWAWVFVRREGTRLRFSLQFTITMPDEIDVGEAKRADVCAINPGWRHFEDGSVRVAYVVGSDGHCEDLRLPATNGTYRSTVDRLAFVDSLHSASDRLFNQARDVFMEMLPRLPEHIQARCKFITQWRSHEKLQRVVKQAIGEDIDDFRQEFNRVWVPERRKDSRDLMPELAECKSPAWYLYCWLRKEQHMYQMAHDISRKAARDRDQRFQIWANRLAERYAVAMISDDDLKKLAEKTDENATPQLRAKSRAATGRFLEKLRERFGKRRIIEDDSANATRACVECGHVHEQVDLSASAHYTCQRCYREQDQDETNCRNRLAWHCERRGDSGTAACARMA